MILFVLIIDLTVDFWVFEGASIRVSSVTDGDKDSFNVGIPK